MGLILGTLKRGETPDKAGFPTIIDIFLTKEMTLDESEISSSLLRGRSINGSQLRPLYRNQISIQYHFYYSHSMRQLNSVGVLQYKELDPLAALIQAYQ